MKICRVMKIYTAMKISMAVIFMLFSVVVLADNNQGFYAGAGASVTMFDDEVVDVDNAHAFELVGGYKYNAWLGVDLRVGKGISAGESDTYFVGSNEMDGRLKREVDNYYSVYYKPEVINDEAKLYLLIGYTSMDFSEEIDAADGTRVSSVSGSESGASYGIGVGFMINKQVNFNIEYRTLPDEGSHDPAMASANFDYRF
jgi:opacity protein-like surface antigen